MYIIVTDKPGEYRSEPDQGVEAVEAWRYFFYGQERAVFTISEVVDRAVRRWMWSDGQQDEMAAVLRDVSQGVGEATDVIDQRIAAMIVVQPVDGEIAAPRVVGPRAEDIIAEQPSAGGSPGRRDFAVLRVGVRTVSRHLDHLAAHAHVRESETAPYQARTAEDLLHLLRARIGGDVVVLGLTIEKQIADATADKLGLKAGLVEAVENGKGAWAEARLGDSMFGRGDDYGVELMGFHSVKRFLDRYVLSAAPRAV